MQYRAELTAWCRRTHPGVGKLPGTPSIVLPAMDKLLDLIRRWERTGQGMDDVFVAARDVEEAWREAHRQVLPRSRKHKGLGARRG